MLLTGLLNAAAMLEVFEVAIGRQRSAGADDGTLNRLIVLDGVKEVAGQQLGRIDGGGMQFQRHTTSVVDAHGVAHVVGIVAIRCHSRQFGGSAVDIGDGQLIPSSLFSKYARVLAIFRDRCCSPRARRLDTDSDP